ncbi:hypothetical protein ACTXT7_014203 [Hymenolepis weldensis]
MVSHVEQIRPTHLLDRNLPLTEQLMIDISPLRKVLTSLDLYKKKTLINLPREKPAFCYHFHPAELTSAFEQRSHNFWVWREALMNRTQGRRQRYENYAEKPIKMRFQLMRKIKSFQLV